MDGGPRSSSRLEVNPIRDLITVLLPDNVKVSVSPGELTTTKPEEEKPPHSYKRKRIEEPSTNPPTSHQDKTDKREDKKPVNEDTCTDVNFDFSVFVLNNGSVLKVGSVCFVDSCSSPFIISRIFKSGLAGSVFVSSVRYFCEGGKVVSVLRNF